MSRYSDDKGYVKVDRVIKDSLIVVGVIILLIAFSCNRPFGTVGAGERGVLLRFSGVTGEIKEEGLYWRWPIIESVKKMDIKVQKDECKADAASKDLQQINSVIAINFHLKFEKVADVYQKVGILYKERLIDPAIQEVVKASTARYTAEELITKRELAREDMKQLLKDKLSEFMTVDELNIVNFDFSKSFNDAIEAKVTAEQSALAAKNKLEQIKYEAQQKIEEAKGKAEAIKIEGETLRSNPQVLQMRAIETWDGKLPLVTGSAIPFIDIKGLEGK
jgi:regulator of protease activity HflC (stomatin/prohibitin superfamily)